MTKYNTSSDKVTSSCSDIDNARTALDDARTAADSYRSNWRVQMNGSYDVSPQKAQLDRARQQPIERAAALRFKPDNIRQGVTDHGRLLVLT